MTKFIRTLRGEQAEKNTLEYQPLLLNILNALATNFEPDELAYLALTSKPEFVIRDAIAFQLYRQLNPKGLLIAREWRHSDIAILENDAPAAIVELKSMYTFDATKAGYQRAVVADIQKARGVANEQTQVFALLLVTHPSRVVDMKFSNVVKYIDALNKAYTISTSDVLRENAASILPNWCSEGVATTGSINSGSAFGVQVYVDFFLYGPFHRVARHEERHYVPSI